jgi:hypothetical protein
MPKKAAPEIKGVTPIPKPLTELSGYDGPYKDGIYPDRFGGKGWTTLRVEDEYADYTMALKAPDGTVITAQQAPNNDLHIEVKKDGAIVETTDLGPLDYLRPHHFGENGYDLYSAAHEHLLFLVQFRNNRLTTLRHLFPGDWIDMFPLLTRLKEDGEMRVDKEKLSEAEDNKFLIEDVEREKDGVVILYTDGGIFTFDTDLQSYEKYNFIRILKHEPKHAKDSMYPQFRRPLY